MRTEPEGFKLDMRAKGATQEVLKEIFSYAAQSARAGDLSAFAFLGMCSIQQTDDVSQMIIAMLGFKCCEMSEVFEWINKVTATPKSQRHALINQGQKEILSAFLPRIKAAATACNCEICQSTNEVIEDSEDSGSGYPLDPESFH